MYLTEQYLHKAIKTTYTEVEKIDGLFKEQASKADYNKVHEELKTNIGKMKDQIMLTKIKTFRQDNKDYLYNRVYTWSNEIREKHGGNL